MSSHAHSPSAEKDQCGLGGHTKYISSASVTFELLEDSIVAVSSESDVDDDFEADTTEEEESDDEEEEPDEEDEEFNERRFILADCRKLKLAANAYLHPENEIPSSLACRCYFERVSAPDVLSRDEADEQANLFLATFATKTQARNFLHPEDEVKVEDATLFGRNFFGREAAPVTMEEDDDGEHVLILADSEKLKEAAADYFQRERSVASVDPVALGRNFFNRPSAQKCVSEDEAEEMQHILADVVALREVSLYAAHPEKKVMLTDPALLGRNFYTRPSTHTTDPQEDEERERVLGEACEMKELSKAYFHPEDVVLDTDATIYGRNFFKASEPVSDDDLVEEKEYICDVVALKRAAADYLHPECGVLASDPAAYGRNYYTTCCNEEEEENESERLKIIAEARALKAEAKAWLHPECCVSTSDASVFGRNFFREPSEFESDIDEERNQILADVQGLKNAAALWSHPECDMTSCDPTAFGRNFFDEHMSDAAEDEVLRAQVLADVHALKNAAASWSHPECDITSRDPTTFGRNFFDGQLPDADAGDEVTRAQVLADVQALKAAVNGWNRPEFALTTYDPTVFGRNFFDRLSACSEDSNGSDLRADFEALKIAASEWVHPERKVTAVDESIFGRNFFNRPSAPSVESEEEYVQVMADIQVLETAGAWLHPEKGVVEVDATAFGRNVFTKPSSQLDNEDGGAVMADVLALKGAAAWLHPETGVETSESTVLGRSFFTRPSVHVDSEDMPADVKDDLQALESIAAMYHPESTVKTVDATAFGRNFFTRPSSCSLDESDDDRADVLADVEALKNAALWFHPEIGVTTSGSTAFGRNYFNRGSMPEMSEHGDVLRDVEGLKHNVQDYLHPEVKIKTSDPTLSGRNYFERSFAPEVMSSVVVKECETILNEARALQQEAAAFVHPETKVAVDCTSRGRNVFNRYSATGCDEVAPRGTDEFVPLAAFEPKRELSISDDYFEMDLEEEEDDVFHEIRETIAQHIMRPPTPTDAMESNIIDKEEEENLSRSPSSVMLFDMAEGNLSRKASAIKLSSMADDGNSRKSSSTKLSSMMPSTPYLS